MNVSGPSGNLTHQLISLAVARGCSYGRGSGQPLLRPAARLRRLQVCPSRGGRNHGKRHARQHDQSKGRFTGCHARAPARRTNCQSSGARRRPAAWQIQGEMLGRRNWPSPGISWSIPKYFLSTFLLKTIVTWRSVSTLIITDRTICRSIAPQYIVGWE
jgi:hypothetical protein